MLHQFRIRMAFIAVLLVLIVPNRVGAITHFQDPYEVRHGLQVKKEAEFRWWSIVQWFNVAAWNEAQQKSAAARGTTQRGNVTQPRAAAVAGHIPYSYDLWMRVHNCEQPETWHAGGHFGNGLPSAGGGLGFSLYAWQDAVRYAANRGVTLPQSMWDASVDEQMQGAQAMLDATGGGPDCL